MRAIWVRAGALALAWLALAAGAAGDVASAATLKAEYELQGTRASQLAGAPSLADIGAANHFTTETVDGVSRQVLVFRKGGGVSLPTAGLVDPTSHSVVMLFRLEDVGGYRRLLDFSGGNSDDGLYDLQGRLDLYVGGDDAAVSPAPALDAGYVQVALTSEATLDGSQWTVAYVNGSPVAAADTATSFRLSSGGLRFFRDNIRGGTSGEQSGGALACALLYDGALTAAEVRQEATDPACPAPKPGPSPHLPYKTGMYEGTSSQHLPVSLVVDQTTVQDFSFEWRAKCADGKVHRNGIDIGGGSIRHGRFSFGGTLNTGGHARVSGRLSGSHARGTLSRWGNSAFNTSCPDRGVRWHAHFVSARLPLF